MSSEKYGVNGATRIQDDTGSIFDIAGPLNNTEFLQVSGSNIVSSAGPADTNIYDNDGTLAGNRTVTYNSNSLTFANSGDTIFSTKPTVDNTQTDLLVRDSVSGALEIREVSSLPGGGSGAFTRDVANSLIEKTVTNADSFVLQATNASSLDYVGPGDVVKFFFENPTGATRGGIIGNTNWNSGNRGIASTAFGFGPRASGNSSFAVGRAENSSTDLRATGTCSVAMGRANTDGLIEATNEGSFAIGSALTASGGGNPATVRADGIASLALGYSAQGGVVETTSFASGAIAHGQCNGPQSGINRITASERGAEASGYVTSNGVGTTSGCLITASGIGSKAQGYAVTGPVNPSTTITASGQGSFCHGVANDGGSLVASGLSSVTFGYPSGVVSATASTIDNSGNCSMAFGQAFNNARIFNSGNSSLVFSDNVSTGDVTNNSGVSSLVFGRDLVNTNSNCLTMGWYGSSRTGPIGSISTGSGSLQIVGGLNNVTIDTGVAVAIGTGTFGAVSTGFGEADGWNTAGADYSEYMEKSPLDATFRADTPMNTIGYACTIASDGMIKKATSVDTVIGFTVPKCNGTSGIVGNKASMNWHGALQRDDFGCLSTVNSYKRSCEDVIANYKVDIDASLQAILDADTETMRADIVALDVTSQDPEFVIQDFRDAINNTDYIVKNVANPAWDPNLPYIPRQDRDEWANVALLGQITVRDDNTCVVGGKCSVGATAGILTNNVSGQWFVLERVNTNIVKILLK